jgi:hypothetical protein
VDIDQIIVGLATAAFSGGAAWAGTQIRIKAVEKRLDAIAKTQGTIINRLVRLVTAHNANHDDTIDTNRIEGGGP